MKTLRFPIDNAPWAGNIFGQTTVFTFGEKEISMAVLFEAPDDENYHLKGLEKAWEAATTTAFIHRQLSAEELIEKVLTAINTAIKESSILLEGAVLLTEGLRVHFSTTGQTGVLLIDDNSVNLVSSSQKSTEFTAVTSGEVDPTDNVILVPSFIVDNLSNQTKINFEKLEDFCHNEKTLIIAAVQDQSPLLSDDEEEPKPKNAKQTIPVSTAVEKNN